MRFGVRGRVSKVPRGGGGLVQSQSDFACLHEVRGRTCASVPDMATSALQQKSPISATSHISSHTTVTNMEHCATILYSLTQIEQT
jgi:hypothetical protein